MRKYISSDKEGKDVFGEFKNIKYTYFTEPVIIDPSMFDDLHSILEPATVFPTLVICHKIKIFIY